MSWHYSQALAEEYLEANCLDGAQFAPSSATQEPPQCYSTDRTLATSRRSPFGLTCVPLTDDRGEALLTWFLAGFPVRMSASQEEGQDWTENDQDSGEKWRASFAKWDRDSCSWKTSQLSLLGDLTPYSGTWPRWGMMRDGECSERTTPQSRRLTEELRSLTIGTVFGSSQNITNNCPILERVPTPTTQDSENNGGPSQATRNTPPLNAIVGGLLSPEWVEWLMGWPIGWTDLHNDDPGYSDWTAEPCPRVTDRRDRRPARLKALGNGQVPQCAAFAWHILTEAE